MSREDNNRSINSIIVGLDVHQDSIAACLFNQSTGEILAQKQVLNQPSAINKFITRTRACYGEPRCCYEASSCGFVLFRQLRDLNVKCEVIAPSSIPRRSGDRIKTDRRDAEKLATMYAADLLTAVEVPDEELEATRALVRCRTAMVTDLIRTKHRAIKFMQTRGFVYRNGTNWSQRFWLWLAKVDLSTVDQMVLDTYVHLVHYLGAQITAIEANLKQEAQKERYAGAVAVLGAFRGIALITALTLVCELGDIRRFAHPRQLMAYLGLVPSEHSSGNSIRRGPITKSGNAHARKAIVSAAWKYAARPARGHPLRRRQADLAPGLIALSWKAQQRLYKRFHALAFRKPCTGTP